MIYTSVVRTQLVKDSRLTVTAEGTSGLCGDPFGDAVFMKDMSKMNFADTNFFRLLVILKAYPTMLLICL